MIERQQRRSAARWRSASVPFERVALTRPRRRAPAIRCLFGLTAVALLFVAIVQVGSSATVNYRHPSATVTGYVQLCGGPYPGPCFVATIGGCVPSEGCSTSDRVAAVDQAGRRVATKKLHHARFRLQLTPGRYTIELLADGPHAHGRALQRKMVLARAGRTVVVRFVFAIP